MKSSLPKRDVQKENWKFLHSNFNYKKDQLETSLQNSMIDR